MTAGEDAALDAGSLQGMPVKLDVFEGPLDLLLHLIRENKVEITDIAEVLEVLGYDLPLFP